MSRATPPPLGTPGDPHLPPVSTCTLSNGLAVWVMERHDLPVVDARVVVRAGAAHDEPGTAGRAYLTADLLDEGTASRSAHDLADEAELLGASLHTRASWDYCAAALHVLTPRLGPALDLLADVITRPTFPDAELERKRAERLSSILQENAEPRSVASRAFSRVLYGPDHPFGNPIGGVRDSIERLSRSDLAAFYEQRFSPRNAFVVVVGDVDTDQLIRDLEQLFGHWTGAGPAGDSALPQVLPPVPAIHVIDRPGAPQSEIRVGHPGPPRTAGEYFPLYVANTVLGGAFTSRLNMLLREEKAYTYGAGSSIAFRAGGGPFLASTAVFTDVTADAVRSMADEIGRMSAELVTEAELARARNYITLGLPRTFETTGDIAEHVSEVALYGLGPDYYDRYAARVRDVTAEAVQASAARWMRQQDLSVVIAGDAERIANDLEQLGLGAVHVREGD